MSLSDIMSHLDLAVYAEVGLVIFFGVFIAITLRVLRSGRIQSSKHAALVLDDGQSEPQEVLS